MRILITAGPTRERIDPVRFISNHSSGKMGYALAGAALARGHEVVLVSGPVNIDPPKGADVTHVESADEMLAAVMAKFPSCGMAIMAAAVADYRPKSASPLKIKKTADSLTLELERTQDILAKLGAMKRPEQVLVGFAAETDHLVDNALKKLHGKNLDWIVANEVGGKEGGFGSDSNAVTIISKNGARTTIPLQSKRSVAERILDAILPPS